MATEKRSRSVRSDGGSAARPLVQRVLSLHSVSTPLVLDRRPGRLHSPGVGRVGPFPGLTGPPTLGSRDDCWRAGPATGGRAHRRLRRRRHAVRAAGLLTGTPDAVAAAGPTVSLLVPRVGDADPRWPQVARDGRIVWPIGAHGVALRSYTARRQDPAAGEVEIDFVLHGDGPAAAWAAAAAPGALLGVAGGGSLGERPAAQVLLAGDETALPAITRILGAAAPGTRGLALIEVADAAEEQPLPAPDGVDVRWLHRDGTPPGRGHAARRRRRRAGTVRGHRRVRLGGRRVGRGADDPGRPPGPLGAGRAQHHAIGYWRRGPGDVARRLDRRTGISQVASRSTADGRRTSSA